MTDMQSTQNYAGIDGVGVGIDKSMGLHWQWAMIAVIDVDGS